jgi:hypothetical protein
VFGDLNKDNVKTSIMGEKDEIEGNQLLVQNPLDFLISDSSSNIDVNSSWDESSSLYNEEMEES